MTRYDQLIGLIHGSRPKSILEVGTWTGEQAVAMCEAALLHHDRIHYTGFDLFEGMTPELRAAELHVKHDSPEHEARRRIITLASIHAYAVTFELIKGNTRTTLPAWAEAHPASADFIFMDGGHSVETIRSDLAACLRLVRQDGRLILDDWYSGVTEDLLADFGCNAVLLKSGLRYSVLPSTDPLKGGGYVHLVLVDPSSASQRPA